MQGQDYLIAGIENPMLDLSVYLNSNEILERYSLEYGRACKAEQKHMPLLDELWKMEGIALCLGGSCLNTLRCVNFLLKQSNPNKCVYFGSIGKDLAAEILERDLAKEGVYGLFHKDGSAPTSTCASLVFNKERTLCWYEGASILYATDHLKSNFHVIERADLFYTTAYFLLTNKDALFEFIKFADERDKKIAFNLSAHYVIHSFNDQINKIIQYADYVFCNEDEARVFAEVNEIKYNSLIEVAVEISKMKKLNTSRPRVVVITQGKDPILLAAYQEGKQLLQMERAVELIPENLIIDTNGAGDAFTGGFLSQVAIGKDFETAIKAGNWMAGQIIQKSGCTFPEVNSFNQ